MTSDRLKGNSHKSPLPEEAQTGLQEKYPLGEGNQHQYRLSQEVVEPPHTLEMGGCGTKGLVVRLNR